MNKKTKKNTVTRASVEALVICDMAQITQDGKLNIIGLFERMYAKSFPMRQTRFYVVGMLAGEPLSTHSVGYSMTSPLGTHMIKEYEMTTRLGYNGRANVLDEINGIIFEYPGIYRITITVDQTITRVYELEILEKDQELPQLKTKESN
jgi:hypothetical protein